MTAKDVMKWAENGNDLSPLIALWVTPHTQKVDELISNAVKRTPDNRFTGYQNSPAGDGYKHQSKIWSGTVTVAPGEIKEVSLEVKEYYQNYSIEGSFDVISGNDIIIFMENPQFNSGKTESVPVSGHLEPGHYTFFLDNTFSIFTSKTVAYSFTINYDEDVIYPQVKAIYESLKYDYNVTYVNALISYPDGTQKVRLPNDALTYGSANCIDGAVLFAAALENIALEPIICLVHEHAFVGWRRWQDSTVCEFLETTMINDFSYKDAFLRGNEEFNEYYPAGQLRVIDIKEARTIGLTPMMKKVFQ